MLVSVSVHFLPQERCQAPVWRLAPVNDTGVPVFGQRSLTLVVELRSQLQWLFTVAAFTQPILDFLEHIDLIVDIAVAGSSTQLPSLCTAF